MVGLSIDVSLLATKNGRSPWNYPTDRNKGQDALGEASRNQADVAAERGGRGGLTTPAVAQGPRRWDRSGVDGAVAAGQGGFADGFGAGRVGVAGAGDVFGGGAEFHGDAGFGNQFAGCGPMIWTPSTRSVSASARILTKPSPMSRLARALA